MGRRAKPAKAKVRGSQSAPRKSPKTDDARVRDLERHLAETRQREAEASKRESEALEQQTATSEILCVISSSPADLRPVLMAGELILIVEDNEKNPKPEFVAVVRNAVDGSATGNPP